jgi:hypothetical protein
MQVHFNLLVWILNDLEEVDSGTGIALHINKEQELL